MESEAELEDLLLSGLSAVGFDTEFYSYCDQHNHKGGIEVKDYSVIQKAIAEIGFSVKVDKSDRSLEFISDESFGECGFYIQVLRAPTALDFTLVLVVGGVNLSNKFTGLAREIASRRENAVEHVPPYPKPTFLDRAEMGEILRFNIELFRKAKNVCVELFKKSSNQE